MSSEIYRITKDKRGKTVIGYLAVVIGILLVFPLASAGSSSGMAYAELKHPAPPPPLPPGQYAGTYPVGFFGLNYNVDNANTLELDLGAARTAGAEVTSRPDRVEVYQHSSPSVLITFYGTKFEHKGGKIVGKVTRADFVTSPLIGKIDTGEVTGTIRVDLAGLTGKAFLTKTIDANVSPDISDLFGAGAASGSLGYNSAAFTMNITKVNLEQTGAANLTFTVPSVWVMTNGGIESVRIARTSEKDHTTQVLDTRYLGTTPQDTMKFTAYSPDGTSIFGMITTKAVMAKGGKPSEGVIMRDIGMFMWVFQTGIANPYLVAVGGIVLAGILYAGWNRKRILK